MLQMRPYKVKGAFSTPVLQENRQMAHHVLTRAFLATSLIQVQIQKKKHCLNVRTANSIFILHYECITNNPRMAQANSIFCDTPILTENTRPVLQGKALRYI